MDTLIKMRPKELHYKTKFIEVEMTNFYTYKKFYKDFKRSFDIDYENSLFQRKKLKWRNIQIFGLQQKNVLRITNF